MKKPKITKEENFHRSAIAPVGMVASHRAHAPHLKSIAADPVTQHAYAIDHEVHAHRMRHVLRARKTGLHQGEPRLHEHHEEAREQRPHDIDGNLVVTYGVHHFAQRRICRILDCDVFGGTRGRSGGIADRSLHLCLFRGIGLLLCPTGRRQCRHHQHQDEAATDLLSSQVSKHGFPFLLQCKMVGAKKKRPSANTQLPPLDVVVGV